jgi:Zn2+/Cd2+-exporting ATPase
MSSTTKTCSHDHSHDHAGHVEHSHEPALATTVLSVPDMCCPTESGMVEKELRRLHGVTNITADALRRQVRVEYTDVSEDQVLAAARQSGLAVELHTEALPPGSTERSVILIEKMDCPTEEALIRKRLGGSDGVASMSFNLMQRKLTVNHTPGRLPDVMKALEEIGLGGSVQPSEAASAPAPKQQKTLSSYWKLIVGGLSAIAAEALAFSVGDAHWGVIGLALVTIALTGLGTYKKGWFAVRQFNLNINALMSVAVTGAIAIGRWPEAAMVMFLFAVAELIEAKSLDRARRAVEGLMAMTPETATVKVAESWETVPAAAVAIGTLVRARPGERIALDGEVVSGATSVNQAPITGESIPVDKAIGDPLFAGTINQNGEVEYRTTAASSNSTLARIVRAVQDAQGSKAPTQRFVDTFSAYYTPAVFAIALAVAVMPPLVMGGDWLTWVYRALVMLVIACPCALVISTPVTVVSGLTAAARRGILIKGGLFLEQGHRLTVLALDKTGTLTQGRPSLTDVVPLSGTRDQNLSIASALAQRSDHPVSRAVSTFADGLFPPQVVANFKALNGRGVEGDIEGVTYRLGNHRLVEELNACSPALEEKLNTLEEQGKTAIVLVANGQALAIFAVADAVRPNSREAIAELKALGIQPVMLTGDNRHTADAIARQVGIEDVRSELLPEQKLEAITVFQSRGAVVGMVGDGINDAPALAKAEIGFAMGAAGTDTAIETADVALMDDDPRKLVEFIRMSRATHAVLWQNITLALGIKAVFLALAIFGQATLWMAVFADMGASLLVVMNGLRLLRSRV